MSEHPHTPPPNPLELLSIVAASSPRIESPSPSQTYSPTLSTSPLTPLTPLPASTSSVPSYSLPGTPTNEHDSQETVKPNDYSMDTAEDRSSMEDQEDEPGETHSSAPSANAIASSSTNPPPASSSSGRRRVSGRKNLTLAERKDYIEKDDFAELVNDHKIKCCACKAVIKLDNRQVAKGGGYYLQFWLKHRDSCTDIPVATRIEMMEEDINTLRALPLKRATLLRKLKNTE